MINDYQVQGHRTGTPQMQIVASGLTFDQGMAIIDKLSRPRLVKGKGRQYVRFYDWQWLALLRARDRRYPRND